MTKTEVNLVSQRVEAAQQESLQLLDELQLALVGGGAGDIIFQ